MFWVIEMFHYWKFKLINIAVRIIPPFLLYWIVDRLADLLFVCNVKQRKTVVKNIETVLEYRERKSSSRIRNEAYQTARRIFRSFGYYLVEFFSYDKYNHDWLNTNVTTVGCEYIDEAFEKGKGVVVATAHIGSWELAGAVTSLLGYPSSAVYLPHDNEKLDRMYVEQRESKGLSIIPFNCASRECLKKLKQNGLLALLCDLNLSEKGITVNLFGKEIEIPRGPVVLSLRTGAALTSGFLIRVGREKFELRFFPLMEKNDIEKDATVEQLSNTIAKNLEKIVSEYPEQWCIFEDIFKNKRSERLEAGTPSA